MVITPVSRERGALSAVLAASMVVVVILVTGVAAIFLYGLYEIRPGSSASGSSSGTETGTMPLSTASSITLESSATTTSNSSTTGLATSASQSRASSSETLTTTQPGQHISSASGICVAGNTKSYQDRILLTYGLIATGLWNLRSASGDVRMCYQPSGINATIGLTNVTAGLVQPGDFVGYPEVAYWFSAGDTQFGQMEPNLTFPIRLDALSTHNLSASVTYSASAPGAQPLDLAYDLWIEGNPQPNHGAQSNDLELMIWMDNQTFGGPGPQVWLFETPAVINGSTTSSSVWGVHVSMPTTQRPHELVVYLLTHPMKAGSISVKISNFIEDAMTHYWHPPSNPQSYYLMGIELGSEFAAPNGSASYDWKITEMALQESGLSITLVGWFVLNNLGMTRDADEVEDYERASWMVGDHFTTSTWGARSENCLDLPEMGFPKWSSSRILERAAQG